jgi:acylphosphatase
MSKDYRCVKIVVAGRVQGVYFRAFTQKKAKDLGVTGTVKNLIDGNVEIIAQAENSVLEQFINWCRRGPITAKVERILLEELAYDESFHAFDIIR